MTARDYDERRLELIEHLLPSAPPSGHARAELIPGDSHARTSYRFDFVTQDPDFADEFLAFLLNRRARRRAT